MKNIWVYIKGIAEKKIEQSEKRDRALAYEKAMEQERLRLEKAVRHLQEVDANELVVTSSIGDLAEVAGQKLQMTSSVKNRGCVRVSFTYKGYTFAQELDNRESAMMLEYAKKNS